MKNTTAISMLLLIATLATFTQNSSVDTRPRLFTDGIDKLEMKRFQMWFIMNHACAVANKYKLFQCAEKQQSNTRMTSIEKFNFCLNPIKRKCEEEKQKSTFIYKEVERKLNKLKRAVKRIWNCGHCKIQKNAKKYSRLFCCKFEWVQKIVNEMRRTHFLRNLFGKASRF